MAHEGTQQRKGECQDTYTSLQFSHHFHFSSHINNPLPMSLTAGSRAFHPSLLKQLNLCEIGASDVVLFVVVDGFAELAEALGVG